MNPFKKILLGKLIKESKEFSTAGNEKTTLVFAPHPDDESLGCGGTIAKIIAGGGNVHVVFVTDGTSSHRHLIFNDELKRIRIEEAKKAAAVFKIPAEQLYFLEIPDGSIFKNVEKVTDIILNIFNEITPDIIFIPSIAEFPPDHYHTNMAVLKAIKKSDLKPRVFEYFIWYWYYWPFVKSPSKGKRELLNYSKRSFKSLFGMETLKLINTSSDISSYKETKIAALKEHKTQMEKYTGQEMWQTLESVSNGDFLKFFFLQYEFFRELRDLYQIKN